MTYKTKIEKIAITYNVKLLLDKSTEIKIIFNTKFCF